MVGHPAGREGGMGARAKRAGHEARCAPRARRRSVVGAAAAAATGQPTVLPHLWLSLAEAGAGGEPQASGPGQATRLRSALRNLHHCAQTNTTQAVFTCTQAKAHIASGQPQRTATPTFAQPSAINPFAVFSLRPIFPPPQRAWEGMRVIAPRRLTTWQ